MNTFDVSFEFRMEDKGEVFGSPDLAFSFSCYDFALQFTSPTQ